jgi:hypothetical protein
VIAGFESVRQSAREAIESVGMRPVMAEMVGARPQSPRQALLAEVRAADVYLLLLGMRYGRPGTSGSSPTEDEFEEAKRRSKPIVILRQEVVMEPEQRAFMDRATGGWEKGILWDRFTDERDVGMKVVKALTSVRKLGEVQQLTPVAQERADALARGEDDEGYGFGGGSRARVALVPLVDWRLLDEVTLDDPSLPDRLSEAARSSRLISQASAIDQEVRRSGIRLDAGRRRGSREALLFIGDRGEILVEGSVAGDDPHFGSSRIDPERLTQLIGRTTEFASGVWEQVDPRGQVTQLAVVVGIPEANMRIYGRPRQPTSSMSVGGAMRLPNVVVTPEPAMIVRRADVGGEELHKRLVSSVRRVFADASALEEGS